MDHTIFGSAMADTFSWDINHYEDSNELPVPALPSDFWTNSVLDAHPLLNFDVQNLGENVFHGELQLISTPAASHSSFSLFPESYLEEDQAGGIDSATNFKQCQEMEGRSSAPIPLSLNEMTDCYEMHDKLDFGNDAKVAGLKGQPAKNLMAERRRRWRINERLWMLRSVVPIVSKMDKSSTLIDTIEYVKFLLREIQYLHHELKAPLDQHFMAKHIPKVEVGRSNGQKLTNIQMCCPLTDDGQLMSTLNSLESFGLHIQQGVISCFSDFEMQVCCSQKNRSVNAEHIRSALVESAGKVDKDD